MAQSSSAQTIIEVPERFDFPTQIRSDLSHPRLEIRQVHKEFTGQNGKVVALDGIDLTVMTGEFLCLVGPSGCGKTTLLNLVAEFDRPDRGEIALCETDGSGQRLMIFQEPALFPWLTVWENVAFGLRIKGLAKDERKKRALECLALVHLEKFAGCNIHELSGGMKQRVALARALVLHPEILLMDEPFSSLDIQTREILYKELLEIWQRTGTTILFITHNVEEAVYLGDRVLVLAGRPGRVRSEYRVEAERPRDIKSPYLLELQHRIASELLDRTAGGQAAGNGETE